MISTELLPILKSVLPADAILTREEARKPFESDGLTAIKQVPGLVLLPTSRKQLLSILSACRATETPIVLRGAGTGLSGGARPLEDGVLLVMSRFDRIIEIDVDNCIARVEPGVRNLAISEMAAGYGLYYAPDPSSQIACSIGGNVAENAGGVHCLKYGLTVHNVIGLTVLTIEGEELKLGGMVLDSPGYDLLALMIGSEGMLGVVTEVIVRLLPIPPVKQLLLGAFNSVEQAGNAVSRVIAEGIIPAGMEMMDKLAIEAAEQFVHAGYPVDAQAILLCELDGNAEDVDVDSKLAREVMLRHGAYQVLESKDNEERELMWKGRKSAFPAVGRIQPDYYCMDGTIPRSALGRVLGEIAALSKKYDLAVANVFHAGDGNLHPLILYDANIEGQLKQTEEMGGKILEYCVAVGGTITGEHGVGIEKLDQMCVQFSPLEIEQFHRIKAAFDEKSLLNPGKAIPTLSRCSELGGMHVHGGVLPFPELERF
ncbi:MAG: FAD-binding protein [Pseudomonadales bacterium]|nr:FAD-binding protein [Pseudomonadales bacterium]